MNALYIFVNKRKTNLCFQTILCLYTYIGYAGSVMVINVEIRLGKPSSDFVYVSCIH